MEISHWIWYTDSVENTAVAVTVQGGNGIRKDYRDGGPVMSQAINACYEPVY